MTINSKTLAALVVSILLIGILISSGTGWWKTESSKIAATFTEGEFAGQANPADIRGSYTFGDVEKNFGIPATLLGQAFGVTTAPTSFQAKGLEGTLTESGVEIGTASIRLFVAFYTGRPFDLSTDIYLPESAAKILIEKGLTAEQSTYLTAHTAVIINSGNAATGETVPLASATPQPVTAPTTESPSTTAATDRTIKGKTTFGEILSWGLSKAVIEQVLGIPMPGTPSTTIKDFCSSNNLVFETIKPALQLEVDKIK